MDNFGNPTGAKLGFYGASMSVGGLVAYIVGGPLNDYLGRHTLVFVGAALVAGMVIMETFSTSLEMFSGAKLILGFGSNLQQLAAPVLVTELAYPKQLAKGRIEEARQILIKYHGNGVEDDVVKAELQEIIAGLDADKTMLKPNKEGIKTILGSKGNRHRLWLGFWTAIGSQCLGSNFVSTYLPLILDQVGTTTSKDKTLINGLVNIWQWVCAVTAALVIPRVGRRTIFLTTTTGNTVTFIIWTALTATYLRDPKNSYGIGTILVIFAFSFFTAICWIPLLIMYPLEMVTTKQRGIFFSWTMFCVNASSFIASYLNPVALENIQWRYYIVQCVFNALVLAIVYFTFVETRGLTLEEVAVIFDGSEGFDYSNAMISAGMGKEVELAETTQEDDATTKGTATKTV
ncbi:putative MFS hexose transporter [Fusarium keratoplasticum]|nr:putative MFS hexose transporter [Fusarium keratoplasticum]